MEGLKGVYEFHAGFSVDEQEAVSDSSDAGASAVADVIVEDVTKFGRAGNCFGIAAFFGESSHFASGFDGVCANVSEGDSGLSDFGEVGDDRLHVSEASAALEKFGVELHFSRESRTGSVDGRRSDGRRGKQWGGNGGGRGGRAGEMIEKVRFCVGGSGSKAGVRFDNGRSVVDDGGPPWVCWCCWRWLGRRGGIVVWIG